MLGVRLEKDVEKRLGKYAKKSGKNKSVCVKEAIREWLDRLEEEEWHDQQTLKGRRELEQGLGIPAGEVYAYLNKWGKK